jgi:putative membrane protein insertion efficiency factor
MNEPGDTLVEEAKSEVDEPRPGSEQPGSGRVGRSLIGVIRGYQLARSGRPTGCRYLPTCSEYTSDAIAEHGVARGLVLAARRLLRCTPWGGHGFDPVPRGKNSCTHH